MSELKHCAHCGRKVSIGTSKLAEFFSGDIYCDCGAQMHALGDTEEEAIENCTEAWNRRFYNVKDLNHWAWARMECCDEPEWTLLNDLYAITRVYLMKVGK